MAGVVWKRQRPIVVQCVIISNEIDDQTRNETSSDDTVSLISPAPLDQLFDMEPSTLAGIYPENQTRRPKKAEMLFNTMSLIRQNDE